MPGSGVVTLEEQRAHPVPRELQGSGKTDRTAADDEDGYCFHFVVSLPLAKSWLHVTAVTYDGSSRAAPELSGIGLLTRPNLLTLLGPAALHAAKRRLAQADLVGRHLQALVLAQELEGLLQR